MLPLFTRGCSTVSQKVCATTQIGSLIIWYFLIIIVKIVRTREMSESFLHLKMQSTAAFCRKVTAHNIPIYLEVIDHEIERK